MTNRRLGDSWAYGPGHPFMTPRKRRWSGVAALTATSVFFVMALGAVAVADNVINTVDNSPDATLENLSITVGGGDVTAHGFWVQGVGSDGEPGCNFDSATEQLVANVNSSNAAAVTVSPTQLTFTACGQVNTLNITIHPVADGISIISLSQVSNNTRGSFDFAPATFRVIVDDAPTVTSTSPANGATNVAVDANITVDFSESVNVNRSAPIWLTLTCDTSGAHTGVTTPASGATTSFTFNPDTDFTNGETCDMTVHDPRVQDADTNDPPDTMAASVMSNFTVVPAVAGPTAEAGGPYSGAEGSDIQLTGSASDTSGAVTYNWSVDTTGGDTGISCAFSDASIVNPTINCNDDSNPPGTFTLTLEVTDANGADTDAAALTVTNVPPTVTSITPDKTSVVVGEVVKFTGSAADQSSNDTAAEFTWSFDTGLGFGVFASDDFVNASFDTCGSKTIQGKAKDKDDGVSAPATSSPAVTVYDAQYLPPLVPGMYNLVQKGRVVPVQVTIGCNGVFQSGLQPKIQLLSDDKDAETDPGDGSVNVDTLSVSSADTTGVMREVDGKYFYNLAIPTSINGTPLNAGEKLTIRVNLGGGKGGIYIVLQIRK